MDDGQFLKNPSLLRGISRISSSENFHVQCKHLINLELFKPDTSEKELLEVLKLATAHKFINKLLEGRITAIEIVLFD